ncbi:MAG: flagellar protein FlaG [Pseudomonadota bacterium]
MTDPSRASSVAATGTFRTLRAVEPAVTPGGNSAPAAGNSLPDRGETEAAKVARIAEALNNAPSIGRNLRFEVDLSNGTSVIQVLDRDTGEIIRQIPPEKITTYLQSEGDLALRLYDELV